MARIVLMISLAAASLAAKDRAWQTGKLLDKSLNPYFKVASGNGGDRSSDSPVVYDSFAVSVNVHRSSGDVVYDDYVIDGGDTVYMVEVARWKSAKAAHLSLSLPLSFAVEKNKLYIKDLDRDEYETQILKQVQKGAGAASSTLASVEAKPDPATAALKQDAAPAKPAPAKAASAKAEPAKVQAKPDPFAVGPAQAQAQVPAQARAQAPTQAQAQAPIKALVQQPPSPAVAAPVAQPQPPAPNAAPKVEAAVSSPPAKPAPPASKPDPKPAPKVEAAVVAKASEKPARTTEPIAVRTAPKPEPVAKPESAASARGSSKDRAWQSGQLLSIVNNSYFLNVTYSSDSEGTAWPFTQGSDGRYTVNGQIGNPTNSLYTYDNYVIESQFCVYLVQRMRPKTSPAVRLPGTKAMKFAVEKNKLWALDEENIEYETKVVKLVQKDAIVDPLTRAAAR